MNAMPVSQVAGLFGCTLDQLGRQFTRNAKDLRADAAKALATRKNVRGKPAAYWAQKAAVMEARAAECRGE